MVIKRAAYRTLHLSPHLSPPPPPHTPSHPILAPPTLTTFSALTLALLLTSPSSGNAFSVLRGFPLGGGVLHSVPRVPVSWSPGWSRGGTLGTELGRLGDCQLPSCWGFGEPSRPLLPPSEWASFGIAAEWVGEDLEWTIVGRLVVSCLHWPGEASWGGGRDILKCS